MNEKSPTAKQNPPWHGKRSPQQWRTDYAPHESMMNLSTRVLIFFGPNTAIVPLNAPVLFNLTTSPFHNRSLSKQTCSDTHPVCIKCLFAAFR